MQELKYQLLDSGDEKKLERFGLYTLVRPCAQAIWRPTLAKSAWQGADAYFSRDPENRWRFMRPLPTAWQVECGGVLLKVMPTDFGHIGVFPEHAQVWNFLMQHTQAEDSILNLFAYTGGATATLAKIGAKVCHLDASKAVVAWARENGALNGLEKAPIRWIVDDVLKFLQREEKRGVRYEGIVLDPPTFGRGNKGEVFKIEKDLRQILQNCRNLLSKHPKYLFLSCHTPGYTPLMLKHVLMDVCEGLPGVVEAGELVITGPKLLPSGVYACWRNH